MLFDAGPLDAGVVDPGHGATWVTNIDAGFDVFGPVTLTNGDVAVVVSDVPPDSRVLGNPGRVVAEP